MAYKVDVTWTEFLGELQAQIEHGTVRNRSAVIAYAIQAWREDIAAGIAPEKEQMREWIENYVLYVWMDQKRWKTTIHARPELLEWIREIGTFLEARVKEYDFLKPFLRAQSGYNRQMVIVVALQRQAEKGRRAKKWTK